MTHATSRLNGSGGYPDIVARLPGWLTELIENEVVEERTILDLMDHGLTDDEITLLVEQQGRPDAAAKIAGVRLGWESGWGDAYAEGQGPKMAVAPPGGPTNAADAEQHRHLGINGAVSPDLGGRQRKDPPKAAKAPVDGKALAGRSLISKRASEIVPERVQWVWPGRIAVGKQTCIGGDPGTSKSTLSIAIAAAVTKGTEWPCGEGKAPKGNVIILSAEDGAADTIIPRLLAAGAYLDHVRIVSAVGMEDGKGRRSFSLQADLDLLEAHIREIGNVVLIIIDPISSYMGKGDSHKNTEVRQVLEPVAEMATRMRVAVLTITHFSKSGTPAGTKALHRFIGSIAFIGAARAGFAVVEDPDDKGRRLFLHAKNNLAPPPQGLAYRLEERVAVAATDDAEAIYASTIVWDGEPVGRTADDVLGVAGESSGDPTRKDAAMTFLRDVLGRGEVLAKEVMKLGAEDGFTPKAIRKAKEALRVVSRREGFGPGSKLWWSLPGIRDANSDGPIGALNPIDDPLME